MLDAAERVMADGGFDAATIARVVDESGIPLSSVYHYYGSKDGILLAVMERGARRFFADLPPPGTRSRSAVDHLAMIFETAARALERHPYFLRLLIVFAVQPPANAGDGIREVVRSVRELALERLRQEIAVAFDDDPRSVSTERLARFALAAFDGAFLATQADRRSPLDALLAPLAPALAGARQALIVT